MELNRKKLGVQEVNQHECYGYSFYNKKKKIKKIFMEIKESIWEKIYKGEKKKVIINS